MSRIAELFLKKQQQVLNVYCTAGYPQLNSTLPVMKALQQSGADIIELGMPYSDPLADGEVIQGSSTRALQNGMSMAVLFEQLANCRTEVQVPLILMGYMNPVLQYGFENFCAKAAEVGVNGLILPDLPLFEYETEYAPVIKKYGLDFIFLVTPETSEERIRKIDKLGSGFIYAVSSASTTGNNKRIEDQEPYFERLKNMQLQNPILVGFGIKDNASFEAACRHTNGAIIGSAYIKAIENAGDIAAATSTFLDRIVHKS
jgi:tryptophan synthase alpha chain